MSITSLDKKQFLKIVKTAAYIAVSGAVTALITYATDNKESFGAYYVIVNLALVTLKQFVTPKS